VVRSPRAAESKGQQNTVNTLNEKKNYFLCSTIFKLSRQIIGNSINYCDFLKFVVSVRGEHCDYSPPAPENLATPLMPIILSCHP
jgi:hypothetical protein